MGTARELTIGVSKSSSLRVPTLLRLGESTSLFPVSVLRVLHSRLVDLCGRPSSQNERRAKLLCVVKVFFGGAGRPVVGHSVRASSYEAMRAERGRE